MLFYNRLANPMHLIDFKQFQTTKIRFEIKKLVHNSKETDMPLAIGSSEMSTA